MNPSHTYNDTEDYWKNYQKFFPLEMQINSQNLPAEEVWEWNNYHIHLDRFVSSDSKLKVVLLHGAGGNGRLLAPYAKMIHKHGHDVVSIDLPPYGLSFRASSGAMEYMDWVKIVEAFIDQEFKKDGKPIVLLGASIGGILAYHVACISEHVEGLIATTFVDTSNPLVRDQIAPNKLMSRAGKIMMDRLAFLLDSFRISVSHVSRMKLISNNNELTKLIIHDPRAASTKISIRFLRTFMNMKLMIEPENFDRCPVLLVHPEIDPMTPYQLSDSFFKRLKSKKTSVILEGAGHFPIEQPGLQQMQRAIQTFLNDLETSLLSKRSKS